MMRVLVTAATKYGATAEIAQTIAEVLGEHGHDPTVLPPEQVRGVDGYDAVVVGSAVYAGHWLKPAKELVDRLSATLAERPVWLFSSGPVGDPPKPQEDPVDVSEILTATRALEHRLFAGKLVRKQLSFPERAIVSALHVPEGDLRDWTDDRPGEFGPATLDGQRSGRRPPPGREDVD
jgi:menaquinone-dependent protoporphyrinogen oxidase